MPVAPAAEELAKRFGLETIPDSVKRLNQLLNKCDATNTAAFAALVNQDAELTARVLRAANPRAESEEDYGIAGQSCGLYAGAEELSAQLAGLVH